MILIRPFSNVGQGILGLFLLANSLLSNFIFGQSYVLIDSSGNGYTLLGQDRECIAYNYLADGVVSVNRAYTSTGVLNVHSAPGNLSTIYHDLSVYNQEFGPARYSCITACDYAPYFTFSYLIGGSWGGVAALYESGGWFSSNWSSPVDIGPGNINASRSYLKELPDGNIHFAIHTSMSEWLYRIYTPDLATLISSGLYPLTGWSYWGSDCNGGRFCIGFYKFFVPESVYKVVLYRPEVDTWNLAIPGPYGMCIEYTQLALTDSGLPLLVFNWRDLSDSSYPYRSKIYVSYASGVPPVEITSVFPDSVCKCIYPTIATGGNNAVVIFNKPRNNQTDSLCWMDIYRSYSTDNGYTWSIPENITAWSQWRLGLQQIAKRIDTTRNRFYYIFARDKIINYDPLWHLMNGGVDPFYIYWGYASATGIIEENTKHMLGNELILEVYPNPAKGIVFIGLNFNLPTSSNLRIYDVRGHLVKDLSKSNLDNGKSVVIWDGTDDSGRRLSEGVYFIRLDNQAGSLTQKVIIIR